MGFPRIGLTSRRTGDGGEREFSGNDIDHGNEILDGSESTSARLGGLDEAVDSFQDGIGQPRGKGADDSIPMSEDGACDALEIRESTALCP